MVNGLLKNLESAIANFKTHKEGLTILAVMNDLRDMKIIDGIEWFALYNNLSPKLVKFFKDTPRNAILKALDGTPNQVLSRQPYNTIRIIQEHL